VPQLEQHRRDWEELARLDPLWAVVSDPSRRFGRWDADEFFATGETEVEGLLARGHALGAPAQHQDALEFGCGVGRVTRALAKRYDRAVGIDISTEMLDRARALNARVDGVEFIHNTELDLAVLGDRRFDLVYSRHVLQHLPSHEIARGYLHEMVRVLRPGGLLVLHVPLAISLRHRFLATRRAYAALRRMGLGAETLYRRLHLHPVSMLAVPEHRLRSWIEEAGGRVLAVDVKRGRVVSGDAFATRAR
jgi:SAM-dependent methyltransferase